MSTIACHHESVGLSEIDLPVPGCAPKVTVPGGWLALNLATVRVQAERIELLASLTRMHSLYAFCNTFDLQSVQFVMMSPKSVEACHREESE